ncbi:hypothetical protein ES702_02667 [subsurface metagenome]
MDKKKPRVGSDPLAWIRDTAKTKGKQSKPSKLPKQELPSKQTKRQTYHLEIDLIEKIKKYAYWQRLKVSEVVNEALREFFKGKKFTK